MDEAARCDRVAIIKEGAFAGVVAPNEIKNAYPEAFGSIKSVRTHTI
jgi:ABC-type multidrug transport system ATPase subunit